MSVATAVHTFSLLPARLSLGTHTLDPISGVHRDLILGVHRDLASKLMRDTLPRSTAVASAEEDGVFALDVGQLSVGDGLTRAVILGQ